MSIVSVDNIQPIGSGTTVTVNKSVTLESGNTNITGVCTATSFSGSGANLTSLPAQATIANNADNRVITGGSGVNLNAESNVLYDGTNFGIGKSPSRTLDVQGKIRSSDSVCFGDNSSTPSEGAAIHRPAASSLAFVTNNTERLRIDSSGKVSISSDGTIDGLLTIKGDTDQVGTPSIRLLDGSDTREVSITNTSGDFVASVHGNDNAIHGHIKLFESGIIDFNNGGATGSNVNRLRIATDGNMGVGVNDPKSKLHLGSLGDIRFGSQYGGFAHINQQIQYSAGYSGVHWMFETNSAINWCFDGVLIVYGGGGSSYGGEITKITLVYGRENGANNSGDIWRNGTTSYNIETLGHNQVGLSPGSGSLTTSEDTAPDGAASTRSLFKLGWSSAATGGSTTVWSKLHGTMYWGTGSSGDVEIQDKDGNIFWDSNP